MKHFGIYRKLILIAGTATAAVSVGAFFFMEDSFSRMLFVVSGFVLLCGLLFLLDFLHNRYNDNLLEEITLLIEALVEQQEPDGLFRSRGHPDCTVAASASKTPQYFKSAESNADAGKRAYQDLDFRYIPPNQNAGSGGEYLCAAAR